MEAAKAAAGTGEPVRAGVGQIGSPAQFVRRNPARRHEFVHFETHHSTFRVEPRRRGIIALRYTALQYTVSSAQ
jgi:hypothetical protein